MCIYFKSLPIFPSLPVPFLYSILIAKHRHTSNHRGHGTQVIDDALVASKVGIVHRQDRLITVEDLKSRYKGANGEVVIGRVTSISGKRWRVDLASRGEAVLLLSSIDLPSGEQRRRTAEDELAMREIFTEGDLIAAAVQEVKHDGSIMLQIRNTEVRGGGDGNNNNNSNSSKSITRNKYGRLSHGQLVLTPSSLIKRQPLHFQSLENIGVDVILGMNGFVWVTLPLDRGIDDNDNSVSREDRERIARVSQAVRALGKLYFMIHRASIVGAYDLSVREGVETKEMMGGVFLKMLAAQEARSRGR
jgi:exosome complex component RRP4